MLLLLACSPDDPLSPSTTTPQDAPVVTAEVVEDVRTVIRVTWTTEQETSGFVEFGETTDYGHATATANGAEHEALLLGMPADTDVHFRVVSDGTPGEDLTITTGALAATLPVLTASGAAPSWDGWLMVPFNGTSRGTLILDDQGRIVWYWLSDSDANVLSAFLTAERDAVVVCQPFGTWGGTNAPALRVAIDGSDVGILPVDEIGHHCVLLPDGTIAAPVVSEAREAWTSQDLAEFGPDGTKTVIWSGWDWLDGAVEDSDAFLSESGLVGNWTHIVATDYYPDTDSYLISMKEIGTQLLISRATGEVLWSANGWLGELTHTDGSDDVTDVVHQMDLQDDRLLLFDNGGVRREGSMIEEYAIDAGTLSLAWSYFPDPLRYNYALGDVRHLDDDAVGVVWSVLGQMQDLSRDGEVLWQLDAELGCAFGFTTHVESLYP